MSPCIRKKKNVKFFEKKNNRTHLPSDNNIL